ncbi:MAG: hypothetical protein AAGJ38_10855 [Planctomycetota bacterium]
MVFSEVHEVQSAQLATSALLDVQEQSGQSLSLVQDVQSAHGPVADEPQQVEAASWVAVGVAQPVSNTNENIAIRGIHTRMVFSLVKSNRVKRQAKEPEDKGGVRRCATRAHLKLSHGQRLLR